MKKEITTMKMKKFIAILAAAGMVASLAVGCGSGSDDTASTTDDAAATAEDGGDAAASDWDAANAITVVSREEGSGTRGAFTELFGVVDENDNDMTTLDAQVTNNTSVMMTTVSENEYAIGYISLGSLDESLVKAVKIDGADATAENIENGSYKVSRPFNVAMKPDLDNAVATDFMAYIMSTEGQQVVADKGYIPVSDVEAYAGDAPSGSCVVGGSSSVSPLMEKLIEAYGEVNPNASIELQTSDSTTGMTSAIEGSYDIGMASRELKDDEAAELEGTVIATDGIAVIVNQANPTDDLSVDQVKSIYLGDVTTWDAI